MLLGLLLLGSWGEQPGGVRWDGVHALPPVGAVVLRHSSVSGTFAGGRNALARERLGGDMLSLGVSAALAALVANVARPEEPSVLAPSLPGVGVLLAVSDAAAPAPQDPMDLGEGGDDET